MFTELERFVTTHRGCGELCDDEPGSGTWRGPTETSGVAGWRLTVEGCPMLALAIDLAGAPQHLHP
jgi:hypothetical protein